jgi:hypothetical protein
MLDAKVARLKPQQCINSSDKKGSTRFMCLTVRAAKKIMFQLKYFTAVARDFSLSTSSRPALGSFQHLIQWEREHFPGG